MHLELNHLVSCLLLFSSRGRREVNKASLAVWDVTVRSCWSHLILMTANYPLRWDPVPASCHGDITRASVNAGVAAGNHPDPKLTGKAVGLWWRFGQHIWLPPFLLLLLPPALTTHCLNLLSLNGPLYVSQNPPWAPFFSFSASEHKPPLRHKMEIVDSHDVYSPLHDPVRYSVRWQPFI